MLFGSGTLHGDPLGTKEAMGFEALRETLMSENGFPTAAASGCKLRVVKQRPPIPGLVGRGLLERSRRKTDEELIQLLQAHQLVMLNTWSSKRPVTSGTFRNGDQISQLDFVLVRRCFADAWARRARAQSLDLAPWRLGPKHKPVLASLPFRAGWCLVRKTQGVPKYSVSNLRNCIKQAGPRAQALAVAVKGILQSCAAHMDFRQINARLLNLCQTWFPASKPSRALPSRNPETIQAAHRLWDLQKQLQLRKSSRKLSFQEANAAWHRHQALQQARSEIRRSGRDARRQWLISQIEVAEMPVTEMTCAPFTKSFPCSHPRQSAITCTSNHHRDIYLIAGNSLTRYSSRKEEFLGSGVSKPVEFSTPEVIASIGKLKAGKAVPKSSPPAELWKLCPHDFAQHFLQVVDQAQQPLRRLPSETVDCSLLLLPKPHKPSRQPKDLRPIGLQDSSSKSVSNRRWLPAWLPARSTPIAVINLLKKLLLGFRVIVRESEAGSAECAHATCRQLSGILHRRYYARIRPLPCI